MRNAMIGLILIAAFIAGCEDPGGEGVAESPAAEAPATPPARPQLSAQTIAKMKTVATSSNRFALDLYAKLAEEEEGNLFFSPSSIHTALSMTYAGARGNTLQEMHRALALPVAPEVIKAGREIGGGATAAGDTGDEILWPAEDLHQGYKGLLSQLTPGKDAGYKLHVANALWGQKSYLWLKEFLAATQDNYGAGLREVDFAGATEDARKTINDWVEKQTADKIKELLKQGIVTPGTCLVLTNAIYFKGDWASQFDKKATRDAPFMLSADKTVNVPMMHQEGKFGYAMDKDVQVLSMPYKGKDLSMVVLLPNKVDGLAELEKGLSAARVAALIGKLGERSLPVSLPKFKMTSQFGLVPVLQKMGMRDAFTPAADFSGMAGGKGLFITAVIHKAFVDVNEEGTEAAAATAVVVGTVSVPPSFRADHPFLFLIRHNQTGTILFLGRVANPKA